MTEKYSPVTRKLFFFALGWVCGLLLFIIFGVKSLYITAIAEAAVSAIFFNKKYFYFALTVVTAALLACGYFNLYSKLRYEKLTAYGGKTVTLDGVVTDFDYINGSVRLTVRGRINGSRRATVTFYLADGNFDYYDRVSVKGKVEIPENTVSFDGEDYARSKGIYLQGSGRAECLENNGCSHYLLRSVKRLRDYTVRGIRLNCGEQSGTFLTAVLCSEKSKISAQTNAAIYRSGLGHLFAVSGTHVVIISCVIQLLLSRLVSSARIRSAALLTIIWGFAVFAGFSPSVVRACIMMSISQTAVFFRRQSDSANSLGAAAILLTLSCPFVITSVSFLLSFTAALAIGVFSPALCRGRIHTAKAKTLISYICINIFSMPLCAYFFSEISIISVFVNLLLIPICTAALALSFAYMITGSKLLFLIRTADLLADVILRICTFITKSKLSYIGTRYSKTLIIWGVIAIAAVIFCTLKKEKKKCDITKITAVYLAVCIESVILGEIAVKDKIIIIPNKSSYAAIVISDSSAAVFDIGSKGKYAYTVNSILSRYNISDSNIFISDSAVYTSISYSDKLPQSLEFFSLTVGNDKITQLKDETEIDNLTVSPEENGYKISLSDSELVLTSDEICINGKSYPSEGFEWTSEILL